MTRVFALALMLFSATALAEADKSIPPVLPETDRSAPPPPLPEDEAGANLTEPEVNIIHREDRTVEEYRVNGQLRYIKVTPKQGKPYYFVDTDGDGVLDQQFNNLENPPVNQWILWTW